MKVLLVSNDLIAGNLAYLMKQEGHDVKVFVEEKDRRKNLTNLIKKTLDWRKDLHWVGKNGLIVFDDSGYGAIQDELRGKGYTVFGGSAKGDLLESDRVYGQEIFKKCGMQTYPLLTFENIKEAIEFVKKNKKAWVIKQNGHASKSLNYVGHFSDGRDVINVLENYRKQHLYRKEKITLHEKVLGVEIGVGRYFNGEDWVGPIELNLEYKKFMAGDIGPTTSEMGTLAWYESNEKNKLYVETLEKMKPYLQSIDFRGDIEINCIVNEKEAIPLEATPRFGSPIVHLHSEIHESPWGNFLHNVASGKQFDLKWKKGYGIVVLVAVPPFPYGKKMREHKFRGVNIFFEDTLVAEEFKHIHFEEVSWHKKNKHHYISDNRGYVLYVTGHGSTVQEAREKAYGIVKKIHIPKMMYRNDIGQRFIDESEAKLRSWGYIS